MGKALFEANRARDLADAAMVSRSEWYRRMAAAGVSQPVGVQRRLLLERSAYRLTHSKDSVSELGLQAGFENTSGFTRAFRRCYHLSPREFRQHAPSDWRIPPLGGVHYGPGETSLSPRQGTLTLKLIELWIADHARTAEKMVRALAANPQAERLPTQFRNPFPWECGDIDLGQLADRICGFADPWIGLLDGKPHTKSDGTLESRLARIAENKERFTDLVFRFEEEGSWDMTFVDHECEPPQVFSYGSVVLHVIVYTDHARVELDLELRKQEIMNDWLPPA